MAPEEAADTAGPPAPLEDLTVAELHDLADERGVDVPKSAKKAEIIDALNVDGPAEEEEDPTAGAAQLEELTVDGIDHSAAVLTVNGQRFLLTPTDVQRARKQLEVVGYELY